jgi:hypothetical protein
MFFRHGFMYYLYVLYYTCVNICEEVAQLQEKSLGFSILGSNSLRDRELGKEKNRATEKKPFLWWADFQGSSPSMASKACRRLEEKYDAIRLACQ